MIYRFFLFLIYGIICCAPLLCADKASEALTEKRVYNTERESFGGEYSTLAHHQASFNANIIEKLSDSALRWFPDTKERPIQVLDLCCGHGKPTYDLLNKLQAKGINVSKVIGYDISEDQIQKAKTDYKNELKLEFAVLNVENLTGENQYDLIVSFFGFHWVEKLDQVASAIYKALKPEGKLMFFVPLEKRDLYEFRNNFTKNSRWNYLFEGYSLYPFIENHSAYHAAFDQYFEPEAAHTQKGEKAILYTPGEFITFLSSWMQELRYLKTKTSDYSGYVTGMVDSIPESHTGNVKKIKGNILFTEHFFSYQGPLNEKSRKTKRINQ